MKYHELIKHDLERFPLEIKTDSEIGSGDTINICFYVSSETDLNNWSNVGHIRIEFDDPMKHKITPCRETFTTFDLAVPGETNKIWVIYKTSTRLLITCNSVEVVNIEFSKVRFEILSALLLGICLYIVPLLPNNNIRTTLMIFATFYLPSSCYTFIILAQNFQAL